MTVSTTEEAGVLRGTDFVPAEQLQARAARAATGLSKLGVDATGTVAILMRNDHAVFEASFAAARLGAAPVPINWHGSAEEVDYVLRDAGATVLVGHTDLLRPLLAGLPADLAVLGVPTPSDIAQRCGLAPQACALPDGVDEWGSWRDQFEPWSHAPPAEPHTMVYTSGTTGRPKGVRRLPATIDPEAAAVFYAEVFKVLGLGPGARTVITGPLYHSAPNLYGLSASRLGGFLVLQPRFDAEELLQLIEGHRITALHLVPTMFVRLLQLPEAVRRRYDLSSLQHIAHAAAPCPPDIKRAIIEWFGPIVWEYYGGTETSAVVACDSEEWLAHPGTVGRPVATATVRIYDDAGLQPAAGIPGEIFMRAAGMPDFTYQGRPEARAEVERDGLISCGDIGYFDADGYLHLCDRKRDMIISGGVNIYPAEIEACLLGLPGVRDCAVFGVPDAEFGESVAAAIETEPGHAITADGVRDHVRSHLAGFKAPKVVEFHDQLPREDSGKVFKRRLREPHWAGSGRTI